MWYFITLVLKNATPKVNDNNRLGLKSALSFGFTAEGKLRKHTFIDGQYIDQWILGMTREEYEGLSIVPKEGAVVEKSLQRPCIVV